VISQHVKATPDKGVMRWLGGVRREETFISVISLQEIRTGIELSPAGRKRNDLEYWLVNEINRSYSGRILPVTLQIADLCGKLIAQRRKASETPGINDCLLAATALVHGLSVATLNRKHFERLGVELVDF
jgi:predicted nucleic acid-binding protein